MTIFTQHRVRESFLEEYQAPLSDVLATTAAEALHFSPLSSLNRMSELEAAEEGELRFLGFGGRYEPDSPLVDAETARQRVKDEGLELQIPDDGIRRRALDILMDRKREERKRQDVLSRGPGGFLAGTARVATALGASVLDPINVAAAFVPVVGEARYAALLGRAGGAFGRAGVRAGVGAVEGAAGAAILEPLIYGAARQEQSDYDLTDSLLNVGLGTVLGGGLHVGVGAAAGAIGKGINWRQARATEPLPRMLEALPPGTREAALRAAVGQAATGRAIEVERVISGQDVQEFRGGNQVVQFDRPEIRLADPEAVRVADERLAISDRMPDAGLQEALEDVGRLVRALDANPVRPARRASDFRPGLPPDPEKRMPARPVLTMLKKAGGVDPDSPLAGELRAMGITAKNTPGLYRRGGRGAADNFVRVEHPLFAEKAGADDLNNYIDEGEILEAIRDELFGMPRRTSEEMEAIENYRRVVEAQTIVREEVPGHREFLEELPPPANEADYGTFEAMAARELAEFDELQATAAAYGRAVQAAASCSLRRGA